MQNIKNELAFPVTSVNSTGPATVRQYNEIPQVTENIWKHGTEGNRTLL